MNILPKKRWHVRTKANIERVRRDEAQARELEEKEKRRSQISEREAKINFLRRKNQPATINTSDIESRVAENFLGNLDNAVSGRNKEHDQEEKEIKENYEKRIGLLSYLAKKEPEEKPWYEVARDKRKPGKESTDPKIYHAKIDPLKDMKRFVTLKERVLSKTDAKTKPNKQFVKQHKSPKVSTTKTVEELRAMRLQRERTERQREKQLLTKHYPVSDMH